MTERIRPTRGNLWTEKYTPGLDQKLKTVHGTFEGRMHSVEGTKGLFLPSSRAEAENDVLAKMYVVKAVGTDPEGWPTKWFLPSNESTGKSVRHWHTTFEAQGVKSGVVIAASAKAGMRNDLMANEVQIQHDEIVAIGKPLDNTDPFPMYAAPGWVIVEMESAGDKTAAGLLIHAGVNTRVRDGSVQWGRIVELPRGISYDDLGYLSVGLRVAFPYALHASGRDPALEWVDFEGGYRALPIMCLLAVEYEAAPADNLDAFALGADDAATNPNEYKNPYEPGSSAWILYDSGFSSSMLDGLDAVG